MHMHTLGTYGATSVEKADGASEVLVELPNYDFQWQFIYQFTEPVRFEDGDEMRLECRWDNSGARSDGEPIDVTWGEGTDDEMCVANLYITEL